VPSDGKPTVRPTVPPYGPEQVGVRINITPLAERRTLTLEFPAPSATEHYREHPVGYITSLIGHEGAGSLLSLLKAKGWAEGLSSGSGGANDHELINVGVTLTEAGFDHIDDVTDHVFQYVRLLRSKPLDPGYFAEDKQISQLGFRFREQASPVSAVNSAGWRLVLFPPEHVLSANAEFGEFDAELVGSYLDKIRPENLRQLVVGPDLATDQVEERYDVPYGMTKLDAALIERWNTSEIDPALALPGPNVYIADKIDLKADADDAPIPRKIHEAPGLEIWHDNDTEFKVPRANVRVSLYSPAAKADGVKSRVLNELFAALVMEDLTEFGYPLQLAGLSYSVQANSWGLRVSTGGYDQKQPELLSELFERLKGFAVSPEAFELHKSRIVREWRNTVLARPISQNLSMVNETLMPTSFNKAAAADVLDAVTIEEASAFASSYFDTLYVRVLAHGNLTTADATAIGEVVSAGLLADAKVGELGEYAVRVLPKGEDLVRTISIDHDDSTIAVVYQGSSADLESHAKHEMLAALYSTPFFGQLRTEQQLGYTVFSWKQDVDNLPSTRLAIQSPKLGPDALLERIDKFIVDYRETLAAMPEEEYATIRSGLVASMLERETSLGPRTSRYGGDLWLGVHTFDRRDQLAAAVGKVDKATILAFYDETLLSDDSGRLIVRSVGNAHAEEANNPAGCTDTPCAVNILGDPSVRPL
jgi:secreted Zn-dependent insulinase-like peptidase